MGCSTGHTREKGRNRTGRYIYPVKSKTYEAHGIPTFLITLDCTRLLLAIENELKILDLSSLAPTNLFHEHKGKITSLIHLSNNLLATSSEDTLIKIWDMNQSQSLLTLTGHTSTVTSICELPLNRLASGSLDKKIIIWNLTNLSQKEMEFVLFEAEKEISALAALKNGKILSACCDEKIRVFNVDMKIKEMEIDMNGNVLCFCILMSGRVAVGMDNGNIEVLDVEKGKSEKMDVLKGHSKKVNCLLEIDEDRLVSGSDEEEMIEWDLKDVGTKFYLRGHKDGVTAMDVIDEKTFASTSKDKTVILWE